MLKTESEKICQLANSILEPENYFTGRSSPEQTLPKNILCFTRNLGSFLNEVGSDPHHHHRYVLIAAIRGEGRLRLDADTFPIKEREVQIICPFQYHSYTEVEPEEICWIFITFELAQPDLVMPLRSRPSHRLGTFELLLLREMLQGWTSNAAGDVLALSLALLIRRLHSSLQNLTPSIQTEPDLVTRINAYALCRINEPFRIKELSGALGESESNLRARFRELTGKSLGRHLREMRLRQACQLLLTTRLSISEVAERCEYDTVYSFSQSFKTAFGISPRSYREHDTA